MPKISVTEVAEILFQDGQFLKQFLTFCYRLKYNFLETDLKRGQHTTEALTRWVLSNKDTNVLKLIEILLETKLQNSADVLASRAELHVPHIVRIVLAHRDSNRERWKVANQTKSKLCFDLKPPVHSFCGRSKELTDLIIYSNLYQCVILSGVSGVGKTQVARQFAKSEVERNDRTLIAWLSGDNELSLYKSLYNWYYHLTKQICKESLTLKLLSVILEYIKANHKGFRIIVIVDNLNVVWDEFIKQYWLLLKYDVFVLITSCSQRLSPNKSVHVDIKAFDEYKSNRLFKAMLCNIVNLRNPHFGGLSSRYTHLLPLVFPSANLAQLVWSRLIGTTEIKEYLPLEISLFCSYLRSFEDDVPQGCSPKAFIAGHWPITTILKVVSENLITFDYFKLSPVKLLKVLAFLPPDDIEMEFIWKIYNNCYNTTDISTYACAENQWHLQNSLEVLEQYNLIHVSDSKISIHRLTQSTLLSEIKDTDEYEKLLLSFWKIFNLDCLRTKNENFYMAAIWEHVQAHIRGKIFQSIINSQFDFRNYFQDLDVPDLSRLKPLYGEKSQGCYEATKIDVAGQISALQDKLVKTSIADKSDYKFMPKATWDFSKIDPELLKEVKGVQVRVLRFNKTEADKIIINLKVLQELCNTSLTYVALEVKERNTEAYQACKTAVNEMELSFAYTTTSKLQHSRVSVCTTNGYFLEVYDEGGATK